MRLSRLRVDGFKALKGLDWRPAPGLNAVLGPNESGKSSLADFLEAMIFGLPGGAGGEEARPWSGSAFGGRAEFECGKKRLVLERDFGTGAFRCEEVDVATGQAGTALSGQLRRGSGGELHKRYREVVARHMGFFDDRLFRRSIFVPQGELAMAGRDLAEAAGALRSLAAGGGAGYDRALAALEARYYALTSEGDGRRKPGLLDELRAEKTELSAQQRDAAGRTRRVTGLRESIAERRAGLENLAAEAEAARRVAETAREREELVRRRTALVAAEGSDRERLNAAEKAVKEREGLERALAGYQDLATADERFPELVSAVRGDQDDAARLEQEAGKLRVQAPAEYPLARNLMFAAAAGLVGAAALVSGLLLGFTWLLVGGAALAAAGGVCFGLFWRSGRSGSAESSVQRKSLQDLEARLLAAKDKLRRSSAELLARAGGRLEFSDRALEDLLRRYWERRDIEVRLASLSRGLPPPEELDALRARGEGFLTELAVLDRRVEGLDAELAAAIPGEGRTAGLAARADELLRLLEKERGAVHAMELELAAAGSAGAGAAVGERLEELAELIPRQEARCRALQLARTELAASIREFQESYLASLGRLAGEQIAAVTGGSYRGVTLDPETMLPRVAGRSRKDVAEHQLSHGTRAALYLALRLAMGKLISGGRGLPLILDDPLVDLDEDRRRSALRLLAAMGDETQVILLTWDRRALEPDVPCLDLAAAPSRGARKEAAE